VQLLSEQSERADGWGADSKYDRVCLGIVKFKTRTEVSKAVLKVTVLTMSSDARHAEDWRLRRRLTARVNTTSLALRFVTKAPAAIRPSKRRTIMVFYRII
jgi:hypothetical protein